MKKPTIEEAVAAIRLLTWTGKGFTGNKEYFVTIARHAGLRSRKTRHIMKRAKQVIHQAILRG